MVDKYIHSFMTLIGTISVTEDGDGNITGVYLPTYNLPCLEDCETNVLIEAENQISEYLLGERMVFELPLSYSGSIFRCSVLETIIKIPYGEIQTYKQIANAVGSPNAFRAVGTVCSRNPLPIIIPCHRVITINGEVGKYTGGSTLKKMLINHEKSVIKGLESSNILRK